jgi:hypothetical protein
VSANKNECLKEVSEVTAKSIEKKKLNTVHYTLSLELFLLLSIYSQHPQRTIIFHMAEFIPKRIRAALVVIETPIFAV